jgi:hypothetical protein
MKLVRRLQDYWSVESRTASRMGNHSNPDVDFAEVFAIDGLSTSYAIRNIFGLFYTRELFEFLRTPPTDEWNRVQRAQAMQALVFLAGLSGITPRAAMTLCDTVRSGLSLPLVQSSPSVDFTFNYIDQLLKAPNLDALLQHASIPAPFSLLYLLLRHSMMVEYANAAARALGRAPHLRAEPEHVRFTPLPMETPLDRITAAALHGTGVYGTGRRERAGFPQESRGAEGVEDRQAVHVDARRSRSVVASPGRLGHVVCYEALEDHARRKIPLACIWEATVG